MQALTGAYIAKDYQTARDLYAPDVIVVTPDQGELKGRDEAVAYMKGFFESFPDATYDAEHTHETGNTAIDEGYFIGTHTKPLVLPTGESIPPTNQRVRLRSCDFLVVEDGKAIEHRMYFDQMELIEQLGISPG
ncbi:MAG: ester cyclase [Actinomycetota bacterium]